MYGETFYGRHTAQHQLRWCQIKIRNGERGGSVVECRTPEREVGGSKPTAAVLCPWARHFTPRKYWLLPRKRWLRPDMTEKLLTGTLSLNTNKQKSEMRSFKSNENIHKKEGEWYYVVSANKASSVTLQSPGNESQRKQTAILQISNRQSIQRLI